MAIAEWLTRVEEEIQRVENALRESRRRLLRTFFFETLRPANPAVVEDRMRAGDQRIRGFGRRLQMLRNAQQSLIVRLAIILGDRRD